MGSAEAGEKKGQASTEFITMFSASLLVLLISMAIYFMHMSEARVLDDALDATSLCVRISSTISSFVAMGGRASYPFDLPKQLNYRNYTIWVNSEKGLLKVDYGERGVGCKLQVRNITSSNGSRLFRLAKNATIVNNEGVVVVE